MKDVARRAGVSVTTVSHVLNNTRPVAEETRLRVLEAARQLKFYQNVHARRLARGHSDFLGLIVSDIANPFFPEIIKSFEEISLAEGFDLLLCNTDYERQRTEAAVRKMIENKVRGVAVMTSESSQTLAEELAAQHVPAVFLNVEKPRTFVSCIRVDYTAGIVAAIRHLHDLGHREFGFLAGPQFLGSAVIRRKAFAEALDSRGLPSHRIVEGNHKVDGGIEGVGAMLKQGNFPTAILCSNDLMAFGALLALREAGIQVPQDVSVVGFDDILFARFTQPPLTTINVDRDRLGTVAFEALQSMLRCKQGQGFEYVLASQLVVRESTTAVRVQTPLLTDSDSMVGVAPLPAKP